MNGYVLAEPQLEHPRRRWEITSVLCGRWKNGIQDGNQSPSGECPRSGHGSLPCWSDGTLAWYAARNPEVNGAPAGRTVVDLAAVCANDASASIRAKRIPSPDARVRAQRP
jgi:hypothetical protein